MNQKGAHLRQSFDLGTYTSAMPSPTPTTSAVLPLSQPALHPTPTLFAPSPTSAVASLDTLDQLLRDIDVPSTGTDASAVSPNILPPFQPQAASTQQHSFSSPDVSPTVRARPTTSVSYPPGEYRKLRQQNTEYKFILWWCLHHLKSLPVPPPSAGGELDLALRRVLQQTAIAPQFDENSSFEDIVTKFHDMHVQTVTKFP